MTIQRRCQYKELFKLSENKVFKNLLIQCLCFICGLLLPAFLFSQNPGFPFRQHARAYKETGIKVCGFDEVRHHIKDSAGIVAENSISQRIKFAHRTDTTNVVLPVVFHIISLNPAGVTDAELIAAVQNLNDAFGKAGKYAGSTGVNTHISFCFAKTDPDGGITNGITRTTSFLGLHLNPLIEDDRIKALSVWDPMHYINIWVIDSMDLEAVPRFECNRWIRLGSQGYATMPPDSSQADGIVVNELELVFIEQMGHYLGLYHTFEEGCRNNDCNTDGDKVCDTPPDAYLGNASSCTNPSNSCGTDTLSGFARDTADFIANFMDYGNSGCHNQFTAGQAARMQAAIATLRTGLLINKCNPPCNQNIAADFSQSINYPVIGNTVSFTNASAGATSYQWFLDNVMVLSGVNFSHTFSAAGRYKITLKAFGSGGCYAALTKYIIVKCGVTARFYTDKRQIASRSPIFLDSISFFNTSENATSYKWLMKNDVGMAEQVVSTSFNFTYKFLVPGNYEVRLIATNSSCRDTTESFTIPVGEPEPNAIIVLTNVECYQQTKVRLSFYVCNFGFVPLPPGIPVSFYDTNPSLATAHKIDSTVHLRDTVFGKCCSYVYTFILDVGHSGLNSLYAVVNDNGTTIPLALPNTSFFETDYNNNMSFKKNFNFRVNATPAIAAVAPGDTVQLKAVATPGAVSSYTWSSAAQLSCTVCAAPFLIADTATTKIVKAVSSLGCSDTASVAIQIPPYNDFSININDLQCAGKDSLFINFTINNSFKRPMLPKTLNVSFYSGDPTTSNAVLLLPVFSLRNIVNAGSATFSTFVQIPSAGTKVYAVVNDSGMAPPVTFPNTRLLEKLYTNNIDDTAYFTDSVKVQPADTTIVRTQTIPLHITTPIYDPATTLWTAGTTYTLSCTRCANPLATVYNTSFIPVQTANRYGCIIKGVSIVRILPPDIQVQINNVKCLDNATIEVTFTLCMNNNYDSVYAGIPVSFYNENPDSARVTLLGPVYYTPVTEAGNCHTYTTSIRTTTTGNLAAVANDKGDDINVIPDNVYDETILSNNISDTFYIPFTVRAFPVDTSIDRLGSIQLHAVAQGGVISSYNWSPAQFLSCATCPMPVATPAYTVQYILTARNETNCTDTALVVIRTHTTDDIVLPGAFTPNGDGLNDIFYVLGSKNVSLIKNFSIYNRWGQKVFEVQNVEPNQPAFGWNGKVGSAEAATGTFVYSVTVSLPGGKEVFKKGTVVLIK